MCIFYSSNKVPLGAFGISLGESVTVISKSKPVLPEKLVYRYPGPFGHWTQPHKHCSMSIMGRKSNYW